MIEKLRALAVYLRPVAEDISRAVRVDLVAWLSGLLAARRHARGRHAAHGPAAALTTGVRLPWTPPCDEPTSWDLPAFRVPRYVTEYERQAA